MKEIKLTLARSIGIRAIEPFCIVAEGESDVAELGDRETEGRELADLLLDNLPGGTIVAMIGQLRKRYAQYQPELNPFLDDDQA